MILAEELATVDSEDKWVANLASIARSKDTFWCVVEAEVVVALPQAIDLEMRVVIVRTLVRDFVYIF